MRRIRGFGQSRFPRLHQRFQRAAWRQAGLCLLHAADRMELVEVEIGPFGGGAGNRASPAPPPISCVGSSCMRGRPGPAVQPARDQLLLRITVGRGDVVIVDSPVERLAGPPVRLLLLHPHHHDSPHRNDGESRPFCRRVYIALSTRSNNLEHVGSAIPACAGDQTISTRGLVTPSGTSSVMPMVFAGIRSARRPAAKELARPPRTEGSARERTCRQPRAWPIGPCTYPSRQR